MSTEFVKDGVTLDVAVKQEGDEYHGWVYIATNLVFTLVEPISKTPAGIEDFANVVLKKFSQRLANLMGDNDA